MADNLHIEKLTVMDAGDGNGLPAHMKNLTGAGVAMIEQLKNATGLDLPGLLNSAADNKSKGKRLPKELS